MRAAECSIILNSDDIVTKKTLINSIRYSYDKQGQLIKKIITSSNKAEADTVVSETVYTYDSLGQLIKETRDGVVINEMTYDKYGNIKTRNGIAYTYGNSVWKDQLTGYGDKSILI